MHEAEVPYVRIEGRIKRLYSIWKKLQRQKIDLDQVYDLVAARVITPNEVRHCYAALGVIHNIWRPVPGRIKDWIATPRDNLYQSLHTSVIGPKGQPFEVQIRTEEMHRIAEEGVAAHWKYKDGKRGARDDDGALAGAALAGRVDAGGQGLARLPGLAQSSTSTRRTFTPSRRWARSFNCRAARRPWISPTRSTRRSATPARARASTAAWSRCARRFRTAT